MKIRHLGIIVVTIALTCASEAQAQSFRNFRGILTRATARQPLNSTATVTRPTPAGDITVTTNNTFDSSTGEGNFDTQVTLPNNNTASLTGSISITPPPDSVTPVSVVSVSGSFTSPGGQNSSFSNTATFSGDSITVTSTMTPPSGITRTHTNTFTAPETSEEDPNSIAAIIKRMLAKFAQRK